MRGEWIFGLLLSSATIGCVEDGSDYVEPDPSDMEGPDCPTWPLIPVPADDNRLGFSGESLIEDANAEGPATFTWRESGEQTPMALEFELLGDSVQIGDPSVTEGEVLEGAHPDCLSVVDKRDRMTVHVMVNYSTSDGLLAETSEGTLLGDVDAGGLMLFEALRVDVGELSGEYALPAWFAESGCTNPTLSVSGFFGEPGFLVDEHLEPVGEGHGDIYLRGGWQEAETWTDCFRIQGFWAYD